MTLIAEKCIEHIKHALPGLPGSPIEPLEMVNQAGRWLTSVHPWEWLKGRTVDLELRKEIVVKKGQWDVSTKTLEATGDKNLLIGTEDFSTTLAPWTIQSGCTVTPNSTTDPLGGTTGSLLADTDAVNQSELRYATNVASGMQDDTVHVWSVHIKQSTALTTGFRVTQIGGVTAADVTVEFTWSTSTCSVLTSTAPPIAAVGTCTAVTGGWWRLTLAIQFDKDDSTDITMRLIPDRVAATQLATYFWGAQLEIGSTVTAYSPSFTDYEFLAGDQIEITGGTGITTGFYEVASKTDNSRIVLKESPITTDVTDNTIAGTLANEHVGLPTDFDFQRIEAFAATNGLTNTFNLTSRQFLLDLRTSRPSISTLNFWGAVGYFLDNKAGGAEAVPRLEFWPPVQSKRRALRIVYTAGWRTLTADSDILQLPSGGWMDLFFLEVVKAVARGYEKDHEGVSMMDQLSALRRSDAFHDLKVRDGMSQRTRGPIVNGALEMQGRISSHFDQERSVAGPPPA